MKPSNDSQFVIWLWGGDQVPASILFVSSSLKAIYIVFLEILWKAFDVDGLLELIFLVF